MAETDWFWAAPRDEPARDRFVIEQGRPRLWSRVIAELDEDRRCRWMQINSPNKQPTIEDIIAMMFAVVPVYRVNQNRFVNEAAKIPAFAKYLRTTGGDLCNYVSNSVYPDVSVTPEPFTNEAMTNLGRIVSRTLGVDEDWF